ncbi:MAG: riboflavin synthase [Gammaproteobacteria bacterium]|nr:MAG: riboflavin synthase [Gammaproteobacteria bacterium]
MFTGLIECTGILARVTPRAGDCIVSVRTPTGFMEDVALGDSIAVNGICLTATALRSDGFEADVSNETRAHTLVDQWKSGQTVNLEKALTLSTRLGGHLVTGHVDGVGQVVGRARDSRSLRLTIEAPETLHAYLAPRGSVCIDGVSLTINHFESGQFGLNIVPHTAERTTLDSLRTGDRLHIEVDIVARYLKHLMQFGRPSEPETPEQGDLTLDALMAAGFGRRPS